MPDQKHRHILSQGVFAWNAWRAANPCIVPDLRKADLTDRDLSGMDLSKARMNGADLRGSRLEGMALCSADLMRANLAGLDLSQTFLAWVKLMRANMQGVMPPRDRPEFSNWLPGMAGYPGPGKPAQCRPSGA